LRQPPWEALVAFLLSQNNNTARIGKLVRARPASGRRACGGFWPCAVRLPGAGMRRVGGGGSVPGAGRGYRAEYLERTARMVLTASR
jgi:3-methyladenine DNA glycosylase/8-oxoguanine DNA glycosylase